MQYNQVIPCYFDPGTIPEAVVREQNPVYELKRGTTTDEPYKNILELRSDKIVNMLLEMGTIPDFSGYLAVRMEDLLRNGTGSFLLDVARMIGLDGLPPGCSPQDPQPERIGRRHIPDGLRTWIENHLIMRTERLLGYR